MEKPKRQRGDRLDGRWIRDLDSVHTISTYFLPRRCDAEVFMKVDVDVSDLLAFIHEKNLNNTYKTTLFHAITMAIAKTIYLRPALNRFISGRRFYQRNEISLSFMAKRQFADHAAEAMMVLKANEDITLTDVSKKIIGDVKEVRADKSNGADKIMDALAKLPRPIMSFVFFVLNRLNYHGKVPQFIMDVDSNFTTVLMTNLGSIKFGAPYHHLNEWGTNSLFLAIGEIHKQQIVDKEGNVAMRDIVDLGFTLDERIADGFYFARSVKLFKHILANPALLEQPLKESVDYEY